MGPSCWRLRTISWPRSVISSSLRPNGSANAAARSAAERAEVEIGALRKDEVRLLEQTPVLAPVEDLPPEAQQAVVAGLITMGHAKALLGLGDADAVRGATPS